MKVLVFLAVSASALTYAGVSHAAINENGQFLPTKSPHDELGGQWIPISANDADAEGAQLSAAEEEVIRAVAKLNQISSKEERAAIQQYIDAQLQRGDSL